MISSQILGDRVHLEIRLEELCVGYELVQKSL
jgi:hypothetical protein